MMEMALTGSGRSAASATHPPMTMDESLMPSCVTGAPGSGRDGPAATLFRLSLDESGQSSRASLGRCSRTGSCEPRTTLSAVLPSTVRLNPVRPWVAMATMSAPTASASVSTP